MRRPVRRGPRERRPSTTARDKSAGSFLRVFGRARGERARRAGPRALTPRNPVAWTRRRGAGRRAGDFSRHSAGARTRRARLTRGRPRKTHRRRRPRDGRELVSRFALGPDCTAYNTRVHVRRTCGPGSRFQQPPPPRRFRNELFPSGTNRHYPRVRDSACACARARANSRS